MQTLAVMIRAGKGRPQVVKTALQNGDNKGKMPSAHPGHGLELLSLPQILLW